MLVSPQLELFIPVVRAVVVGAGAPFFSFT